MFCELFCNQINLFQKFKEMALVIQDEDTLLFKSNDQNYIKRKIQENEEEDLDIITSTYNSQGQLVHEIQLSLSSRLSRYLTKTRTDDLIEAFNAVLSLCLSLFFALDTYYDGTPVVIQYAEYVILILHTLDYLLFFFISENRLLYFFSFQSICSYVTILPTFLVRGRLVTDPKRIEQLLLFRVFRFFSIFRLDAVFGRQSMSLVRVYFRLLFILLGTVIIFAALMLVFENQYIEDINAIRELSKEQNIDIEQYSLIPTQRYQFHDMVYFLIITVTTVGYGDIYPRTVYGQMLSIGIIFVILALIPQQLSEFSKVNSLISVYARKYYSQKANSNEMHILLFGEAPIEAIRIFLQECFHQDHGFTETNLVIMRNKPPTDEMNNLLKQPAFASRVSYIQGNPIYHKDLQRCLASKAKCCVILSNQFCPNPIAEDQRNILNALAVKKYVNALEDREIRICLQLLKPENKQIYNCALQQYNKVDQVLCAEEIKLQLLAKSSICPGIITIIWSLITSNAASDESDQYDSPEDELRALNEKMKIQKEVVREQIRSKTKQEDKGENNHQGNERNSNNQEKQKPQFKGFGSYSGMTREQMMNGYMDSNGVWRESWQVNYDSGTKYELYRIPLRHQKFEGLKFKDVCMILFQKLGLVLIALEVKIMNQIKVFVNPYDYLLDSVDYFGYVINHEAPKNEEINGIDLSSHSAENFCIMEYIIKQEQTINKKDYKKLQQQLVKSLLEEKSSIKSEKIYYDNYFTTKKPVPLNQARVKGALDKSIEDHIIVCGLVTGIKNLILPLRMKSLGTQMRPIVILSNDMADEDSAGDSSIWGEINRFQDIYIMKGSGLDLADLERARVKKAKAIIVISKGIDGGEDHGRKMLDADAVLMYKTIEANFKNVIIITELASMNAIAFLVPGHEDRYQKLGYYMSKPFASGEIYVSSLLDSLMCQAYYSPKITEILEQMILGSANTSERLSKIFSQLNLSQSSLNLVGIPKKCKVLTFESVFETCIKHYKMIIIAVYKRYDYVGGSGGSQNEQKNQQPYHVYQYSEPQTEENMRSQRKPYVWIHPPKDLELSAHDELFVLCDKNPNDIINGRQADAKARTNLDLLGGGVVGSVNKKFKNEDRILQKDSMQKLFQLNGLLQDLLFSTKELADNVQKASEFIQNDLAIKVKSDLMIFSQ